MTSGHSISLSTLDGLPQAAVALNEKGWFVYANHAAMALLGHSAGGFDGKHFSDLVAADFLWVQSQLKSLKEQLFWAGRVRLHHSKGDATHVAINALGLPVAAEVEYLGFVHPAPPNGRDPVVAPIADALARLGLTRSDLHLLQLMSEGLTESQIAGLLGMSIESVTLQSERTLAGMRVTSKTMAVITAIKAGLIL